MVSLPQICYTAGLAAWYRSESFAFGLRMAAIRTVWVGFTRRRKSIAETIGSLPSMAGSVVCTLF